MLLATQTATAFFILRQIKKFEYIDFKISEK